MDQARSQGISFGELVRRAVEKAIQSNRKARANDPLLSDRAVFRGPVPSDSSENHDKYLYDKL